MFTKELESKLKEEGRRVDVKVKGGTQQRTLTMEKQASQGIVKGTKKAIEYFAKRMLGYLKGGLTNDGTKADDVGEAYAAQREREHGVNPSVVYVASGDLSDAFLNGKAKVKFSKGKLSKALSIIRKNR
jgi:hypothetical protein